VDLAEIQEIYDLRLVLEPHCMRRAVTRISTTLDEAQSLQDKMGQCSDHGAEWVELNRRFHEILTKACGSRRLIEMLKGLRDAAAVYVGLGIRTVPRSQLRLWEGGPPSPATAFRDRDSEAAAAAITAHLQGTMRVLGLAVNGSHGY
jgi:DNA-binding GntR family transcriptional regulator